MPDKNDNCSNNPFLTNLIEEYSAPKSVYSSFFAPSDLNKYKTPFKLSEILNLELSKLSNVAIETLNILEESDIDNHTIQYTRFKWRLTAFLHIQDIFDGALYMPNPQANIFRQWYFYYESKYILTELILAGLNGFYVSTNALTRLFLEFNLLQLYYFRTINRTKSYQCIEDYFQKFKHPSWNTVLKGAFDNSEFTKPIKFRANLHRGALSNNSSHPYEPSQSPQIYGPNKPGPSLEGIYFWASFSCILESVLWSYYTTFPMLFFPLDPIIKFGFKAPLGIFVNALATHVIKMGFDEIDYNEFILHFQNNQDVIELTKYYNSRDSLNDEQIRQTWNQEDGVLANGDIEKGRMRQTAKLRALRESMALYHKPKDTDIIPNYEQAFSIFKYSKWKTLYKKIK